MGCLLILSCLLKTFQRAWHETFWAFPKMLVWRQCKPPSTPQQLTGLLGALGTICEGRRLSGRCNYNSMKQFSRAVPNMPIGKDGFFYSKQRCASTAARTPTGIRGEASGATSTATASHHPREQACKCTPQIHKAIPSPAQRRKYWMEDGDWRETSVGIPRQTKGENSPLSPSGD